MLECRDSTLANTTLRLYKPEVILREDPWQNYHRAEQVNLGCANCFIS